MRVNKITLLLEYLTDEEADEILRVTEAIVLRGEVPHPRPAWLQLWLDELGYDERQYLLVVSTALPQRMLLSVIQHQRIKAAQKEQWDSRI